MHRPEQTVARRHVFYIPGYDPNPPRRYRELYRREAAAQAQISGYEIEVKGKTGPGPYGWTAISRVDGHETQTTFEVLTWSDLVRESMGGSIFATYVQMLQTLWIYCATGALWNLMRLRKGPVLAAVYPVAMLVLQALLTCVCAGYVFAFSNRWLEVVGLMSDTSGSAVSVLLSALAAALMFRVFKHLDRWFFAHYLMHDFAYSASCKGAFPDPLVARLRTFSNRVEKALASDVDEVLIVGHSSGAHLGVHVLADVLRRRLQTHPQKTLSFLTLGHVIPMVSCLSGAHDLRRDLRAVSRSAEITWLDVTAPGDGCSFALCDPVAVSGQSTPQQRWPLIVSAAFSKSLSPARWQSVRWRFFRLHFQYLCAFDRPRGYDYFEITAGPWTLAAHCKGRSPSQQRIVTPMSRFASCCAA